METPESAVARAGTGLGDLARRMLCEAGSPGDDVPGAVDARPLLLLRQFLADDGGEIVLTPGYGIKALLLEVDRPVAARGIAQPHVTAAGLDVTGLSYIAFAGGPTLYYPPGLDIALTPARA